MNAGQPITVFEVLTAAAFLLFAEHPAELCVLEVGLGGRGDATNVIARPAACAIASISMDHREMLGDTLARSRREGGHHQAGRARRHRDAAGRGAGGAGRRRRRTRDRAGRARAGLVDRAVGRGSPGTEPSGDGPAAGGLTFRDAAGSIALPRPSLRGTYQHDNAGIAVAALRAASLGIGPDAFARGLATAEWPARMQRLEGRLTRHIPPGWELWLDGGHNPGGGVVLAEQLREWSDRPVHLVVGMKQAKDSAEFLRPLLPHAASVWAVAEPGQHLALPVEAIIAASGGVARPGPTVVDALAKLSAGPGPARVLICGSLYLAGEVLKQDA